MTGSVNVFSTTLGRGSRQQRATKALTLDVKTSPGQATSNDGGRPLLLELGLIALGRPGHESRQSDKRRLLPVAIRLLLRQNSWWRRDCHHYRVFMKRLAPKHVHVLMVPHFARR